MVVASLGNGGSRFSVAARHEYTLDYDPFKLGAYGPPPADDAVHG